MTAASVSPDPSGSGGADRALVVTVPAAWAEEVGAILMETLGLFEEVPEAETTYEAGKAGDVASVRLVFYPDTVSDSAALRVAASGCAPAPGSASATAGTVARVATPVDTAPPAPSTKPAHSTEPALSAKPDLPSPEDVLSMLPVDLRASGMVRIEYHEVVRDWVDGWKDHFRPIVIGRVRIRPPWEPVLEAGPEGFVEVIINPGLGFGTGLHPTTRGTLQLLQAEDAVDDDAATPSAAPSAPIASEDAGATAMPSTSVRSAANRRGRGRLLDAGTGSGVLSIAAAKLGWGPIVAFDNDPLALVSARENVDENGVAGTVTLLEAGVGEISAEWTAGATVVANMTLDPVLGLLDRLAALGAEGRPSCLVVSGILAGVQEHQLLRIADELGFTPGRRLYEAEWVSLELLLGPVLQG
ncbi:MAG: 50S ribosomal protein L11 methyltransferase [Thermoleophilia bacterium]|jgi:ribosomal protein L11 methyltransferase